MIHVSLPKEKYKFQAGLVSFQARLVSVHARLVSFQLELVNFTSFLESISLNRAMLSFSIYSCMIAMIAMIAMNLLMVDQVMCVCLLFHMGIW